MTLDVYAHAIEPMQADARDRVEAILFGRPTPATLAETSEKTL
jgi:hypothetical protein